MENNLDFTIISSLVVVALVLIIHYGEHLARKNNDARIATKYFSTALIGYLLFILLSLPSTAVLASFGYPKSQEDLNPKHWLEYSQLLNTTVVRLVDLVRNLIVAMVFIVGRSFLFKDRIRGESEQ